MNPISTLYHIAPCCFVFLALPFTYIELPKMVNDPNLKLNIPLLLTSAACAFGGCCTCGSAHMLRLLHVVLARTYAFICCGCAWPCWS